MAHGQNRVGRGLALVAGSSCDIGALRYSSRMIRFLPILGIGAVIGCARPEPYHDYNAPTLKTAAEREQELQQNLRDGRSWDDQQRLMADVKGAFGSPSTADVTGPGKNK